MTLAEGSRAQLRRVPLVAVVSAVPMLSEALSDALDGIADLQIFPAGRGDTIGLLRELEPDAVVVDRVTEVDPATQFAREAGAPVLFISYGDGKLHVLGDSGWDEADEIDLSAEAVRNVLVGCLFGRVGGARTP